MKKLLVAYLILFLPVSFNANAVVGGVTSLFGGSGAPIAVAGLATFTTGMAISCPAIDCKIGPAGSDMLLMLLGIVLLDGEDDQEIEFQKFTDKQLVEMGLTENEILAYIANLEELGTSLKVVSSKLDSESTREESVAQWDAIREILGDDAVNGARKVVDFHIQKVSE